MFSDLARETNADLEKALDAIEEMMGLDKGASEEEWIDWCNRHLPLLQSYGRMKYTIEFS
jgi:hypothetical protein